MNLFTPTSLSHCTFGFACRLPATSLAAQVKDALAVDVVIPDADYATVAEALTRCLVGEREQRPCRTIRARIATAVNVGIEDSSGKSSEEAAAGDGSRGRSSADRGDASAEAAGSAEAEAAHPFTAQLCSSGWGQAVQLHGSGASGGFGCLLEVTLPGADDGVAFTPDNAYSLVVRLHTAQSQAASLAVAAAWAEFRRASLPCQRARALERARGLAAKVVVPPGALELANYMRKLPTVGSSK